MAANPNPEADMNKLPLVQDIMTRKVITLSPDMEIYQAILYLMKHNVSGAPVLDHGKLIGMLSEKDCMRVFAEAAYDQLPGGTVATYMVPRPETVEPTTDLFSVAGIFMHRHYRRLPVVSGEELVGIVSRPDVLRASIEMWGHPDGRKWTDSVYITKEIQAALDR